MLTILFRFSEVAITGIGKTYLAAFDSKEYKRILFVAHREEILKQAERSFANVRPLSERGFFIGSQKEMNKDIVFASVQSLGKVENLSLFERDYFDYVSLMNFIMPLRQIIKTFFITFNRSFF